MLKKNMIISDFTIDENSEIKLALELINKNMSGTIFIKNHKNIITGALTDGDVRRHIISGGSVDDPVFKVANKDFVYLNENDNRELLIKHLDRKAKFIPIISNEGFLINIISRDNLPVINEGIVRIRSRAPVRISFGGGGSDLTNYFYKGAGAVISATINIYSHICLAIRDDQSIYIKSDDIGVESEALNIDDFLANDSNLPLIQAVIRVIRPKFGFELTISSDFPVGSGLGGSATVAVAIIGAFNHLRTDKWSKYEIAELAFEAERFVMGISGGWQDQYASVFGGLNFMEFEKNQNLVLPLNIDREVYYELSENLILCNTGVGHDSGLIHSDQKLRVLENDVNILVQENVNLTYQMRDYLLRGNLDKFGAGLNQGWELKRQFSNKISNKKIDAIYDGALQNGALGGKLLGAGGGGFFLFYAKSNQKNKLSQFLKKNSLDIFRFSFESEGLITWAIRE